MHFYEAVMSVFKRDVFIYCLTILVSVIVARTLGPEILGTWVALSLISQYADFFARLKTDLASVPLIGKKEFSVELILFVNNIIAITSSFFLVVVLFIFQDYFLYSLLNIPNGDYKILYLLILICIPIEFLLSVYKYYFLGMDDINFYNKINVTSNILNFAFIILCLLILNLEILGVVIAKLISTVCALGMAITRVHILDKKKFYSFAPSKNLFNKLTLGATGFYLSGILGNIFEISYKSVGAVFLAKANLAFFNQAEGLSRMLIKLSESVSVVLYPKISHLSDPNAAIKLTVLSFKALIFIQVLLSIPLIIFAKPLIIFLYGIEFSDVAIFIKFMIFPFIFFSAVNVFKTHIEGLGKAHIIPKLIIAPVLISLLISYALVKNFGVSGLLLSFIFGYSLYSFTLLVYALRFLSIPFNRLLINKEDLKICKKYIFQVIGYEK